jgi:glycosyltransferase involved in cell wall biosynthesis
MKILFCPAHYVHDGVTRGSEVSWSYEIADRLAKRYPGSTVVTGFVAENSATYPYQLIKLQPQKSRIDMGIVNSLAYSLMYGLKGFQLSSGGEYDVHHHILPFGLDRTFNLTALFGAKTPLVIGPIQTQLPFYSDNLQDPIQKQTKMDIFKNILMNVALAVFAWPLRMLSRATLTRAAAVIAIDDSAKAELMRRGVREERIYVIPPGISCSRYAFPRHYRSDTPIRILTVGVLMRRKNTAIVIRAFARLHKSGVNVRLDVLGDGPERNQLQRLTHTLDCSDVVIFHGYVPHSHVVSYYQNADVFVTGSTQETFGQMYLEAMASGLPIVSVRNEISSVLLADGRLGRCIPENDEIGMCNALYEIVVDGDLRKRMSQACFSASIKYDWDTSIIPQYERIYEAVLNS